MTAIKRATADDVAELLPLVAEYWRFEGIDEFDAERVAKSLTRLFTEPALGGGWIAVIDGVAAGYLLAVYVFSLEHLGLTAEIDEFFVLASRRGRGAGAALLRAAETEFRRNGCTNASLQLGRTNDAARAFYHRHGYSARSGFELLGKML